MNAGCASGRSGSTRRSCWPRWPASPPGPSGGCAGSSGPGGLYVSEMLTARALVEGNERTARMLRFDDDERPRSAQLYGVAPGTVGEATRRLIGDFGVEHVDLNFGCPAPKVTAKGGGAALPVRRRLLADVIGAAVRAAAPEGVPGHGQVPPGHRRRTPHRRLHRADRRSRRRGRRRPPRPHRRAALRRRRRLGGHRRAQGGGDHHPGARQRRHLGGRRRRPHDGRDRLRRRRHRPGLPGPAVALRRSRRRSSPAARPPRRRRFGAVAGVMLRHAELLAEDEGEATGAVRLPPPRRLVHAGLRHRRRRPPRPRHACRHWPSWPRSSTGSTPTCALPPEAVRMQRGHTDGPRPVRLPDGWLRLGRRPHPTRRRRDPDQRRLSSVRA